MDTDGATVRPALRAIAAGTAFGVAFVGANATWLAPLALVVLCIVWCTGGPARAARIGACWALPAFAVGLHWLFPTLHVTGGVPAAWALLVVAAIVAILAGGVAACGALIAWTWRSSTARLLAFAPLWTILEYTRGWPLIRFPWLLSGDTQVDGLLGAAAPWAGVHGVGFLLALGAASCAGALRLLGRGATWRRRCIAAAVMSAYASATLPIFAPSRSKAHDDTPSWRIATVAHPARDGDIDARLEGYRRAIDRLAPHADLVVLPESIVPGLADAHAFFLDDLHRRHAGTGIVVGMPVRGDAGRAFNAMFGLGRARGQYDKRRLVPFAEYTPFEAVLGKGRSLVRLPLGQFATGQRNTLQLGQRTLASAICYEAAFPEQVRDNVRESRMPALLVMPTSDTWYGTGAGMRQILRSTRMRAMETGLPVVRAASDGTSMLVDSGGRVVASAQGGVLIGTLRPAMRETLWTRAGIAPVALLSMLLLAVALGAERVSALPRPRRRPGPAPASARRRPGPA